MPVIVRNDRKYKEWQMPIITVGWQYKGTWFPVDAYVDSGAIYSIFRQSVGERIGIDLTVAKKRSKREIRVLEDLYSGTFSRLATVFPSILQKSPQVTSYVTHKTYKNPHWKGLEVHVSPFSMQR